VRVVVNQLAALGVRTGIGHYTVELSRCLHQQASHGQIDTFPKGWVRRVREAGTRARPYLEGRPEAPQAGLPAPRPLLSTVRRQLLKYARQAGRAAIACHFRAICARECYDLYHEPNFIPLPCSRPTVATLHDLSVILHPEWHPADRVAHFERNFRRGLGQCVHYFSISESGRQELIRTLHLPPERVTCTYMGIRPGLAPLPAAQVAEVLHKLHLPSQYLLYLGTIEPRKNVLLLLRAYCGLPERVRSRWPLLLVGSWGWNAANVAEFLLREAKHRGVIHLGYVADEHLAALYGGARALVYPSLYEGFGLPPIEMMACGGAVLASTADSLVETVGSRAHLIAPQDLGGWHDAMQRICDDDGWWRSLRRGVTEVARPYTWDRCAADTLRVYRRLCGETPITQGRNDPLPARAGLRAAG
jgi:alpha-1,3-rhamnosyl/mannosyltransferase